MDETASEFVPRVLLLDDYPDSGEALCEWFRLEGWEACCVTTVDDALHRLDGSSFAVLVVEPWLRSGSAMVVAAEARARRAATLLVSISASCRAGDDAAYEPTLFDFNFGKPTDLDRLRSVLRAQFPLATRAVRGSLVQHQLP